MLDQTTEFGARAARRLREELIGWLTTVSPAGKPTPVPVWFLWDGQRSVLLYSKPGKPKLRSIAANPHVSIHLDGDGRGGNVIVLHGEARPSDDPPASEVPPYVEKYTGRITALGWTPASFAADYSVPIRIELDRISGW